MTTRMMPMCIGCKRYTGTVADPTCTAFPDGIPDRIWLEYYDHSQPYDGDKGRRFVAKDNIEDVEEFIRLFTIP